MFATDNGFDNLVVANNGDGKFGLLEGGALGLTLFASEAENGLPNPTSLALPTFNGAANAVSFYAATEGEENAFLVTLGLGSSLPSSTGESFAAAHPASGVVPGTRRHAAGRHDRALGDRARPGAGRNPGRDHLPVRRRPGGPGAPLARRHEPRSRERSPGAREPRSSPSPARSLKGRPPGSTSSSAWTRRSRKPARRPATDPSAPGNRRPGMGEESRTLRLSSMIRWASGRRPIVIRGAS